MNFVFVEYFKIYNLKYILFSDYNFSIRILTDIEIQYDQIIMNTSKLSNYLNFN